ncbi:MAG TPA: amino acid permease, partial [bacterium]|nr:amino acid permease [bacterium]
MTPSGSGTGKSSKARFGTLAGVFTPTILTILGIIFFLRLGWVVGQTGMVGAMIIVALANVISLLTGLSLSTVATSFDVKVGGNYYMISRTLGLEIGGAIGIPLYLSQAISIAFYIIGFTEALMSILPSVDPRLVATVVLLGFFILAYVGADIALRIQFGILAALVLAIISFFAGGWGESIEPALLDPAAGEVGFWVAFAVFFPAVTGIEVGISMSGDLREPSKSIPAGTLTAILVSSVVYLAGAYWMATHAQPSDLISDTLIMEKIARWPAFVMAGVWAASLSSALGSILAAPRTLQALSYDRVLPRFFSAQMGSPTEPRAAVVTSSLIALAMIWMGDLNFVAPIITMFFLNTYGMVNLTAGIEKLIRNPSFRPQINIPWIFSWLGAVGCYGAMFLINWIATLFAIIVSVGIYFALKQRSMRRTWGDVRSGIWFALSRFALLNLTRQPWHVKNWRPNMVVFTGQPYNREQLVEVGDWLSLGKGIITYTQLIIGDVQENAGRNMRTMSRKHIDKYIRQRGMSAFSECQIVPDFNLGVLTIAQSHGIAGLEPNSILMGWSREPGGRRKQMRLVRDLVQLKKSVILLHYDRSRGFGDRRRIQVWWGGRDSNAELMLLLAHIISRHDS